jgi:hypothetical protein
MDSCAVGAVMEPLSVVWDWDLLNPATWSYRMNVPELFVSGARWRLGKRTPPTAVGFSIGSVTSSVTPPILTHVSVADEYLYVPAGSVSVVVVDQLSLLVGE